MTNSPRSDDSGTQIRVFISYSRKDIELVRSIFMALEQHRIDAWVDWQGIPPSAEWWIEVCAAIESSDAFLFFMSSASLASSVCSEELARANQNNKRLIPVAIGAFDTTETAVPVLLGKLNWIFIRSADDLEAGTAKIVDAVQTDLAWVRAHTRLLTRAVEWESRGRDESFVLQKNDLRDAEAWLAKGPDQEPQPTALQTQYILVSRAAATRRQRRLTALACTAVVLIGVGALAAVAGFLRAEQQRKEAVTQAALAVSRQLAMQASREETNSGWARSTLEALAGTSIADTVEARSALLRKVAALPMQMTYLWGHRAAVRSVAFDPTGKLLASASEDGTLVLWDVVGHVASGSLLGHTRQVRKAAFSPDGRVLASASHDGTLMLWDVASRRRIGEPLHAHGSYVSALAFHPDGKRLASAGEDGTIVVWDVASQTQLGPTLIAHQAPIWALAFHPDGRLLASGSEDATVRIWDIASRRPAGEPLTAHRDTITGLAFSPDGRLLATTSGDESLILWDFARRKPLGEPLRDHKSLVLDVAFSTDGKLLASCDYASKVILWSVAERKPVGETLSGFHREGISAVTFSPDGTVLASAGGDGAVLLYDLASRARPMRRGLARAPAALSSVAFSPDGKVLAAGAGDKTVLLWDARSGRPLRAPLEGHREIVLGVKFSPDGKLLASSDAAGVVRLWQVAGGSAWGAPLRADAAAAALAFAPDGRWLATAGAAGRIVLWDPATGLPIGEPITTAQDGLLSVAVSADGRWLASGGKDGTVVIWDVGKRQPRDQPLHTNREVHSLAFSPDGKILATASGNDTVLLWDLEHPGVAAEPLKTNHAAVWEVDFSPNGQVLAVVSAQVNSVVDNKLLLWDVHSRQPLGELAQIWPVFGIAFRPQSGDELAAAAGDGSMTLWRADPRSWVKLACSVVNRNLSRREWASLAGESIPFRAVCPDLPEYLETMH